MIKKHLYSLYNFKKFVKTIKHNYKKKSFKKFIKTIKNNYKKKFYFLKKYKKNSWTGCP